MQQDESMRTLAARVAALEAELARRSDLDEVQAVLARYTRAVDWLDDRLLATVFWDDAQIDYGFFRGAAREFRPLLMEIERGLGKRWHSAPNVSVVLHGDVAEATSYQLSISSVPGDPAPQTRLMCAAGYYLDRFERRQGRWGIARRKHLAVGGTFVEDVGSAGLFAALNTLAGASPAHPDYPVEPPVPALGLGR
jgi:hypothetical protein